MYTNAEVKAKEQVTSLKIVTVAENDIKLRIDDFIFSRSSWQKACLHVASRRHSLTMDK